MTRRGDRSSARPFLAVTLFALATASSPASGDVILVSAAHAAGAGGTYFTTDVQIVGPPGTTIGADFYPSGQGTAIPGPSMTLGSGTLTIQDILVTTFQQLGASFGAIRFKTPVSLLVTATIRNGGVSWYAYSGASESEASSKGVLPGLRQDSGARSNVAFFNPSPSATQIRCSSASGGSSVVVALAPNGQIQVNQIGTQLGVSGTFDLAFESDQPVLGLATVIDNATGKALAIVTTWTQSPICPAPAAPVVSPVPSVRAGTPFSVSWSDVLSGADGTYQVQLASSSDFAEGKVVLDLTTKAASATLPGLAAGSYYLRARAARACGASSDWSSVARIDVAAPPAALVLTQGQMPSWAAKLGDPVPPATLRFRNVGGTAATVTYEASGGFFSVAPGSSTLGPGEEAVVTLSAATGPSPVAGLRQGSVKASWSGGALTAPVTLTLAASLADVVPLVDPDTVYNLASGSASEQPIQVTNPADVPISLATSVGPGGSWLSVDPQDVQAQLGAHETRTVRLRIDRSKRTAADGVPPLFTALTLSAVGAGGGRSVRVFDDEPTQVTTPPSRAGADPATPTFIVPTAVHAAGQGGSLFTSDGWVRNLADRPIVLDLLASPRDGGATLQAQKTLPSLGLVRLYDFVQGVFGGTSLAANVELRPRTPGDASQLVVRVTTAGQPAGGQASQRYASEIPVYASGTGTGVGQPALLIPGVDVTPTIRTNLILSETSGAVASVNVTLIGSDGVQVGRTASPIPVPAYGLVQSPIETYLGLPVGVDLRAGAILVEGATGTGRVVALGTAIDNVSQSFRALSATSQSASGAAQKRAEDVAVLPVVIPAIVHSQGIGAFFSTLLSITNETASPAALRFVYAYTGKDDQDRGVSDSKAVELTLGPRQSLPAQVGGDAVVNLLGLPASWNTSGPLRVEGAGVSQVIVKSWVQTPTDVKKPDENLKFAEFAGYRATSPEVVGAGAQAVVLSPGVSKVAGQRTNLILAEVTGQPAQVRVRLIDGVTGLSLGQTDPLAVGPFQKLQINDDSLWGQLGLATGERDRMQVVLEALGGGSGRVVGVLTQIASSSNATLVMPFAPVGPQRSGIGVGR